MSTCLWLRSYLISPHQNLKNHLKKCKYPYLWFLDKSSDILPFNEKYWAECRQRLDHLTSKISRYCRKQLPLVFTYFEDATSKQTCYQVSYFIYQVVGWLLITFTVDTRPYGPRQEELVGDYHFLIMNPATIQTRLVEEVEWLSNHF